MRKRICSILIFTLFLLALVFSQHFKTLAAETKALEIVKTGDYIDIDKNTVKFLFKTNKGAKVDLYLGNNQDELAIVKTEKSYDFNKGLKVTGLKPGKEYFYKIVAQKDGKKLESAVLSFAKLANTDTAKKAEWARRSVFYEVFVRSFADGDGDGVGDFKGLKDKVGYLKDLGVDALWLMPCFDSPSCHGYDVTDYYAIEPDYGTMADFEAFLQEAHKNGIKVILDLVVNHTSTDNKWFQESAKGEDNPYRDYYTWKDSFDKLSERGPLGPQVWYEYDNGSDKLEYYYAIFWSGMPDLNLRNAKVREELKNIAKFWLLKGVDGFRLDAAMHIDNKDAEVTHNWWQEFNTYVKSINTNAFLIGENWATTEEIAPYAKDLDASFNFPLHDILLNMAKGNEMDLIEQLNDMYAKYSSYSKNFMDGIFLTNHDMNRVGSEIYANINKHKLAAALLLTLPGSPFIYYGEELGQKGSKPDENIREPFDWYAATKGPGMVDPGGSAMFTEANDGISLEEQQNDQESIYNYYKKLIKVRKANPIFFTGKYVKLKTVEGTYGYKISGKIAVIHNLSMKAKNIKLNAAAKELLTGKTYAKGNTISLKAYGTLILKY